MSRNTLTIPTREKQWRLSKIGGWNERATYKHQCGFAHCPSCREYVNVREHKCYIQKGKSLEEEKAEKHKKRGKSRGLLRV